MHMKERYLEHVLRNCPHVNATRPHWWSINIASGNGLVLSGNKPLPEPMLNQISEVIWRHIINTLGPRRNEQNFAYDICKRIFFNENVWISVKISLKFVPKGSINNIPALVQIMAWRRPGDKPLSEPMMVYLQTHICVTRPQWVKPQFCTKFISRNITPYLHFMSFLNNKLMPNASL